MQQPVSKEKFGYELRKVALKNMLLFGLIQGIRNLGEVQKVDGKINLMIVNLFDQRRM